VRNGWRVAGQSFGAIGEAWTLVNTRRHWGSGFISFLSAAVNC